MTFSQTSASPASIIAIGAGNRMRTYMQYALDHPDEVRLVAVVEPDEYRRNALADKFGVPSSARFAHYEEFFANPVKGDAVVVCTPDDEHYRPCIMAIELGYNVLLEKPIAQTAEECLHIERLAREKGVLVGVCYIMRFHPCFSKIKELVDNGGLGTIVSIDHSEGVGIDRTCHSYVRGIFNCERTSNPMLTAKCSHDVDFMVWLTGGRCRRLVSYGSLKWFREGNAPAGSAVRCIDCKVESTCPYSAVDLYKRRGEWIGNFNVPAGATLGEVVDKELRSGRYGRCVYHCDNDVVDNQHLMMEMDDGTTMSLSMNIFTTYDMRRIVVMMSGGEIYCNEKTIRVTRFADRSVEVFNFEDVIGKPYHAGADMRIMRDFLHALRDKSFRFPAAISDCMEGQLVCIDAERSRVTGQSIER